MHFNLVDRVLELSTDRIVTIKQVSAAEEYLADHFPGFPVLPGVFMLEAMVQAARHLTTARGHDPRLVLGQVRALKYGRFVRPGEILRVEVDWSKDLPDGAVECRGEGRVLRLDHHPAPAPADLPVAVSGKFSLRPVRTA